MRRVLGFTAVLVLGACSGGTKAYIPVDSPLRTWEPPESDTYASDPEPAPPPAPPAVEETAPATQAQEKKAEKRP
jgi:hypothetical protein